MNSPAVRGAFRVAGTKFRLGLKSIAGGFRHRVSVPREGVNRVGVNVVVMLIIGEVNAWSVLDTKEGQPWGFLPGRISSSRVLWWLLFMFLGSQRDMIRWFPRVIPDPQWSVDAVPWTVCFTNCSCQVALLGQRWETLRYPALKSDAGKRPQSKIRRVFCAAFRRFPSVFPCCGPQCLDLAVVWAGPPSTPIHRQ
jgi:hypothetical protein